MCTEETGIEDVVSELAAGQSAIVAALVIALHNEGVLHRDRYTAVLRRLWANLPENEMVGEAGAVIERMLDTLDAHEFDEEPHDNGRRSPVISRLTGRPVNDDVIDPAAPNPLQAFVRAFCGPVWRD